MFRSVKNTFFYVSLMIHKKSIVTIFRLIGFLMWYTKDLRRSLAVFCDFTHLLNLLV